MTASDEKPEDFDVATWLAERRAERAKERRKVGSPLQVAERKASRCAAACQLELDEHTKTAVCSVCGRVMEAFEALLYIVRRWDHYVEGLRGLRGDVEILAAEKGRLKREVGKLRKDFREAPKLASRRSRREAEEKAAPMPAELRLKLGLAPLKS